MMVIIINDLKDYCYYCLDYYYDEGDEVMMQKDASTPYEKTISESYMSAD